MSRRRTTLRVSVRLHLSLLPPFVQFLLQSEEEANENPNNTENLYDIPAMVYQGKPSAGCANCRKRKIKVSTGATLRTLKPYGLIISSAMNCFQHAHNASTPEEYALAMSPASTSFSAIRPNPFEEKHSTRKPIFHQRPVGHPSECTYHHEHHPLTPRPRQRSPHPMPPSRNPS